jgi:RNA polymerase sigma factor (sigma-70 family)
MTAPNLEADLEREHPHGFAWAVRCCDGDRSEAEDVLHLAYVKILEGRARFDGRSAFRTWLFGVIRRTVLEQRRRRWLQGLRFAEWFAVRREDHRAAPDPAALAVASDTRERLEQALGRLSRRQQEMMHLVFYQDLSIQEAAQVLGMPVGTARTHYQRGKARLRVLLRELEAR